MSGVAPVDATTWVYAPEPSQFVAMADGVVIASGTEIHTLNLAAASVWAACEERVQLARVADQLAVEFSADPTVVRRDVVAAARGLIDVGLLAVAAGEVAPPPAFSKPLLQPAPACSACGPGPDYEHAVLVDVGAGVLAIGADDQVASALEHALGDRAIGRIDHPEDRPAYGVVLPSAPSRGPMTEVSRLHRGPDVVLRSRSPERVLDAVLAQIATHLIQPGEMVLEAMSVGRSDAVVVVPIPKNRVAFERAAARAGLRCADIPSTILAADEPTVVTGAAALHPDRRALAEVAAARHHLEGEPDGLAWGRYRVASVLVAGPPTVASVLGEMAPSVASETTHGDLDEVVARLRALPVRSGISLATVIRMLDDGRRAG